VAKRSAKKSIEEVDPTLDLVEDESDYTVPGGHVEHARRHVNEPLSGIDVEELGRRFLEEATQAPAAHSEDEEEVVLERIG
jgi:hypothetical protein